MRLHRNGLAFLLATVVVAAAFLLDNDFLCYCRAKEIQATKEWQLLGENDTVDAGMHIRMDLSTGQKWVKLLDDADEDDGRYQERQNKPEAREEEATGTAEVRATSNGGGMVVASDKATSASNVEPKGNNDNAKDYDFDMMHGILSQLPPEEQERIGGIPELPPPSVPLDDTGGDDGSTSSKKERERRRAEFEARLAEIWERRQEELRAFSEDHMADLPEILKDRIRRIREYLRDPHAQLTAMKLEDDAGGSSSFHGDDEQHKVTHIVSVLQDLEYHLTDVDMARDFHTLGGWPLLVSLIADSVHESVNYTRAAHDGNQQQKLDTKVEVIQATAAWAAGNAVKNTAEFAPWTVQPVFSNDNDDQAEEQSTTTPLALLLTQFVESSAADAALTPSRKNKIQKLLYGMGCMLRGNCIAQSHFLRIGGPDALGERLAAAVADASSSHASKMTQRLLSLAQDLVTDVQLRHEKDSADVNDDDKAIVKAFTSDVWCSAALMGLQANQVALQETALRTIRALTPECLVSAWDALAARGSIVEVQTQWKNDPEMDPDILQERLELIDATLALLSEKAAKESSAEATAS